MKLTAVNSGFFVVSVDGADVSQHTTEREAAEAAINAEALNPSRTVKYRHDYVVKVESTAVAVTTAALTGITTAMNS